MDRKARLRLDKETITGYIDPKSAASLQKLCDRTRVPKSVYIREAIDMLLRKYRSKK